jgi:hypothetical protein
MIGAMHVAKQNEETSKLQALAEQIAAGEASLRPHFENTPTPSPEAMGRIKAAVRSEAIRLGLAHRSRRSRFLPVGAIAAAILVAAGAGLYFEALQSRPGNGPSPAVGEKPSPQASRDTEGLDAFAASLSRVMSDEDPAVGELNRDLQDLESEHWSNG